MHFRSRFHPTPAPRHASLQTRTQTGNPLHDDRGGSELLFSFDLSTFSPSSVIRA